MSRSAISALPRSTKLAVRNRFAWPLPGSELAVLVARYERMPAWQVDGALRRNGIDPRDTVAFVAALVRQKTDSLRERGLLHLKRLLLPWEIRPRSSA